MFSSIKEDIRLQFQSGNMLTRIILVNIAVFVFIKMVFVFTTFGDVSKIYTNIIDVLTIHADIPKVYVYFWGWFTHMFLHEGTWHLIWNMLLLYWFGRIVGDFLGDERMLPLYILGGLAGGVFFVLFNYLLPGSAGSASMAMGASAAVMCMLMTAAMLSPDYHLHLLLIGPVKLKWIAIVMLFFDLIGTAGQVNTGGHFAHLGGATFGILYVARLHSGKDLTSGLQKFFDFINNRQEPIKPAPTKKAAMSVVYHKGKTANKKKLDPDEIGYQNKLDAILDKINDKGYDNLSDEEKDFLSQASKKE